MLNEATISTEVQTVCVSVGSGSVIVTPRMQLLCLADACLSMALDSCAAAMLIEIGMYWFIGTFHRAFVVTVVEPFILCFTLVSSMCLSQLALEEAIDFIIGDSITTGFAGPRSMQRSQADFVPREYYYQIAVTN